MALTGTEVALISGGINFLGGLFGRKSASKQKKAEEAFLQKKYDEYDLPLWNMQKDKLIAQRDEIIRSISLQQRNEKTLADFKDKNNLRNYQHSLKIREAKYQNDLELKRRSDFFTNRSIESGISQQKQEEFATRQQYAFENEENIVESIVKKGEMAVTSQTGLSAVKAAQSELYDQGRQQAIMIENILTQRRDSRMRLNDFILQQEAGRMLKPSKGIAPLKPLKTPLAEYQMPRALGDFDFGPQPIKGVSTTQVPSFGSVLAGAVGSGFSAFSNMYQGTAGDITNTTPPPTGGGFNTYATSTQGFGGSAYSMGGFNTNTSGIFGA
tara:strand:- start:14313 stop:15290 length:978 start_codon:yes stop_codon:yes gene_type:complete